VASKLLLIIAEEATMTMDTTRAKAAVLADFVDTLIPGDEFWPPASTIGIQGLLAARLLDLNGEQAVEGLIAALEMCGGPFAGKSEEERVAIVEHFERDHPSLFALVREAAYFAYYENPLIVDHIRAKGHSYRARPHLSGYALPSFDIVRDKPSHQRGGYVATDSVRRVDLDAIHGLQSGEPPNGRR
jgi:hypothetical protein